MTRHMIIGVVVALLVAVTAGVAVAMTALGSGYVDAEGKYHGCVASDGLLRVILPEASCKKNETAIDWNQVGPQGEPGPSEAFNVRGSTVEITSDGWTEILRRDVPAGSYVVTGRAQAFTRAGTMGPRFVTCMITDPSDQNAGNQTVEMETPPGSPGGAAGLPLVAAVQTPSGGTVRMACSVFPFSAGDSVGIDGHIVITRVGTLHLQTG